jgi:hypothetical protein
MLYGGRVEEEEEKKKKTFFFFFFFKILFFSLETVHTIDLIASDRRRRSNDADAENNLSFLFLFSYPRIFCSFLTHKWGRSIERREPYL